MGRYQYVLLDWDGNLAKTLDVWLEAVRIPLAKRGFNLSDIEIAECFGAVRTGFEELGVTDIDEAITEMDELAEKMLPQVDLYPDALYVLEELKASGRQTALITTSWRKNVLRLLDKYDIRHYFDEVVAYDDTELHKPDPEPLEEALRRLGGSKDQAVMIGDSDKDIGAAANAGIDSILFYPTAHTKFYKFESLKMLNPIYIVDDFRKVLEII